MKTKVICYVRMSNGKRVKLKSVDGQDFKDKKGNTYTAPVLDNKEIMETDGFLGKKRIAWYREAQPKAIPLDREAQWRTDTTKEDKDVLIFVTKQALMEANLADMKANITLGGLCLLAVLIVIDIMMG